MQSRPIPEGDEMYKMVYSWMDIKDYKVSCCELHNGTSCTREFLRKYENVFKNNWLFYLILHAVPFLLFKTRDLKKRNRKQRLQMLFKLFKHYCGSILFMGTFVGFLKLACCMFCRNQATAYSTDVGNSESYVIAGSLGSTLSIFFESRSRQMEIAFFVFARAFKAYYEFLKRRNILNIPHIQKILFVLVFGMLNMVYYTYPEHLKNKLILDKTLGKH